MDVSCPKCRTEYELDDARIAAEGTTVKCTECSHVFRVKKAPPSELPPPPPSREWKVRQTNGNMFSCRELTTLQRWIIEGKVGRDDEISLTGDTWKRLGNIPELASFFQVAEDAARARLMGSTPSPAASVPPAAPTPLVPTGPQPPAGKSVTETWREPGFVAPLPEPARPPPPPVEPPPPPPPSMPVDPMKETLKGPGFSVPPPPTRAEKPRPYRPPAPIDDDEDDEAMRRSVKGGGAGKWVALIFFGLLLGGGAGYYFGIFLPEQQAAQRQAEQDKAAAGLAAAEEAARARAVAGLSDAERLVAEASDAGAETQASDAGAALDAGAAPDAGAAVDAGAALVAEAPDAGAAPPVAAEPVKVKRTYDWYMTQGDRLREREKAEKALDMYGQAADLEPDRVGPVAGRGLALLDMGQLPAAQASFEQAVRLNSRYGPALMGLAETYRMQKKTAKALEYYQKYLDVLPNGPEAAVARNNLERLK